MFRHIVRIFKNARQELIRQGVLDAGVAPSYYLEGLLCNTPDQLFVDTYQDTMVNVLNWLWDADRSTFLCANQQYLLLDGNVDVTWNQKNCNAYLNGLVGLWKGW